MAANARKVGGGAAVLAMAVGVAALFEGSSPTPYRDVGGVPTVCYGHTGHVQDRRYSPDECLALLRHDMGAANATVYRCIRVPMTIGQEVALTDAAYNVGPRIVCGSTLQRMANAGNWLGACAQLSRWDKAAGQTLPGLVKRRADERAICEGR